MEKEYRQFLELNRKYHKIVHDYFEKEIAKGNEDIDLDYVYFDEKDIILYICDCRDSTEDFYYRRTITKEEMIKLGLLEETTNSENIMLVGRK